MPLVTVITAAYNAEAYVAETIRSVMDQTFRDYEYIVIDDGSSDNTAQIVQSFGSVIYVYQANQGVASARNAALAKASGEYVAIIDADDVWLPAKLDRQMAAFRANPSAGLCCTNVCVVNAKGEVLRSPSLPHRALIDYEYALTRSHHIVNSSVMMRKCYLSEQAYDFDLPPCEDFLLNLRVLHRSGPGIFLDEVLVRYRERKDSISRADRRYWMTQYERAVARFLENVDAIRPLSRTLRRRAIGHVAFLRAQTGIAVGECSKRNVVDLVKALVMNPTDAYRVSRQFVKLLRNQILRKSTLSTVIGQQRGRS